MPFDSRDITKKNYKCVKATINSIKKIQKQQDNEKSKNIITLFSNIKDTKYVHPTSIDKMTKLVGNRLIDAVMHVPVNYELWQKTTSINNIKNGDYCCIETTIKEIKAPKVPYYIAKQKRIPTTIKTITFDGYYLDLVFFNIYPSMLGSLTPNKTIICQGKLSINSKGCYTMSHPHITQRIQNENGCNAIFKLNQLKTNDIDINDLKIHKIVPIYSLTEGIKQNQIVSLVEKILANDSLDFSIFDKCDDILSYDNQNIKIPTTKESLKKIHFPQTIEDILPKSIYLKKLSFLELLSFQYALSKARLNKEQEKGIVIQGTGILVEKLLKNLPFSLTDDQIKCFEEIKQDQAKDKKMLRLLQGDVGSGKTLVALLSALNTIESGHKVVIMAPTAILAKQHFNTIQKFCFGTGITAELLIGETKIKTRKDILTRMKLGQINILVGTHTLFQSTLELPQNIGLFIIDEQHNFGVEQRVNLINKCQNSDILMMTATPIPRTMIMGLYGDIEVSCINNKPADRLPIITKILNYEIKYKDLIEALKRKIKTGEQIYWICPLVEESEKLDYIDVSTRAEALFNEFGKENVGVLHGKMTQDKKDKIMLDFKNKKFNLLIATTVIEVGIDVPNATIIVIENAEKFGLAQLHQLRGRVGRGDKQSYCFLLYGNKVSDTGKQRLEILKNNDNGFKIAEFDLQLRGGGTLLNNKQSGFKTMNFVDFVRDKHLINFLNKSHVEKIEFEKIKPIIDLFSYTDEVNNNGVFKC